MISDEQAWRLMRITHGQVTGHTDTPTDDESPGVHDPETGLAAGDNLEYGSDAEDQGAEEETPFASKVVSDRVSVRVEDMTLSEACSGDLSKQKFLGPRQSSNSTAAFCRSLEMASMIRHM